MDITLLIVIIAILLTNLGLLFSSFSSNDNQKKILAVLKDLQDITNVDTPKELSANLTDIGSRLNKEEAIENITRTNSIWPEDGLDGEDIEDIYAR